MEFSMLQGPVSKLSFKHHDCLVYVINTLVILLFERVSRYTIMSTNF